MLILLVLQGLHNLRIFLKVTNETNLLWWVQPAATSLLAKQIPASTPFLHCYSAENTVLRCSGSLQRAWTSFVLCHVPSITATILIEHVNTAYM